MNSPDVKQLYDPEFQNEILGAQVPAGTYHVSPHDSVVDQWDDGRDRLEIPTTIACGEFKGRAGPRYQITLGGSSGVNKTTGKEFTIEAEDTYKRFRVTIKNIAGPLLRDLALTYDTNMLERTADVLNAEEPEFITVARKDGDWLRASQTHSLDEPPARWQCDCQIEDIAI